MLNRQVWRSCKVHRSQCLSAVAEAAQTCSLSSGLGLRTAQPDRRWYALHVKPME